MICKDYKGWDKVNHAVACFALATISPMVAIGAAIGKEFGDRSAKGNHWCWMTSQQMRSELLSGMGCIFGRSVGTTAFA